MLCPQKEKHMSLGTRSKIRNGPAYNNPQFVLAIPAILGSTGLEVLLSKKGTFLPGNIKVPLNYNYRCCLGCLYSGAIDSDHQEEAGLLLNNGYGNNMFDT